MIRVNHFSLLSLAVILTTCVSSLSAGALFRYRSYTGSLPSGCSAITSAGNISHTAMPAGDVDVTVRGSGFTSFEATDFDGATEFVGGDSSINTSGAGSDDSFSIEVIFNARATDGQVKLLSNTEANHGFCLRILDGRLSGLVRMKQGSTPVDEEILQPGSSPVIKLNAWHRAIFTVTRETGFNRYRQQLYLDGAKIAERVTSSLYDGVFQCGEPPMVGAEPHGGTGNNHFFNGLIHSAVVRGGTLPAEYLAISAPRDGSANLGLPAFPEFLDSRAESVEKLANTVADYPGYDNVLAGYIPCPLLNDSYVPQGVASDGVDNFFLSMYWKKKGGDVGQYPSLIAQVGFDGQLRRIIQLLNRDGTICTSHVGGCAYYDGKIYVPRGSTIFRYDLDDLPKPAYVIDGEDLTNVRGDQNRMEPSRAYTNLDLKGNTVNSFMEIATGPGNHPYMWVGQWDTQNYKRILGFQIDANGDIASDPTYNFKLFRKGVQGLACFRVTSTEISFYGTSNPGEVGTIFAADYPLQPVAENTVRPVRTVGGGPKGIEDLTVINGNPWTVSESACIAYGSSGSADAPFYPFIYGMKGEASRVEDALHY